MYTLFWICFLFVTAHGSMGPKIDPEGHYILDADVKVRSLSFLGDSPPSSVSSLGAIRAGIELWHVPQPLAVSPTSVHQGDTVTITVLGLAIIPPEFYKVKFINSEGEWEEDASYVDATHLTVTTPLFWEPPIIVPWADGDDVTVMISVSQNGGYAFSPTNVEQAPNVTLEAKFEAPINFFDIQPALGWKVNINITVPDVVFNVPAIVCRTMENGGNATDNAPTIVTEDYIQCDLLLSCSLGSTCTLEIPGILSPVDYDLGLMSMDGGWIYPLGALSSCSDYSSSSVYDLQGSGTYWMMLSSTPVKVHCDSVDGGTTLDWLLVYNCPYDVINTLKGPFSAVVYEDTQFHFAAMTDRFRIGMNDWGDYTEMRFWCKSNTGGYGDMRIPGFGTSKRSELLSYADTNFYDYSMGAGYKMPGNTVWTWSEGTNFEVNHAGSGSGESNLDPGSGSWGGFWSPSLNGAWSECNNGYNMNDNSGEAFRVYLKY